MYNNLHWEPPVCFNELVPPPVLLFRQCIGKAITHHCMEELFSRYEPEWSLLSEIEAATYIQNYLRSLMETIPNGSYHTYLLFISFIGHLCVQAIRTERCEIVQYILMEASFILFSRCSSFNHMANLNRAAINYNAQHRKTCGKSGF
ncbi:uncharacterized protein TNIN_106471 [Trichonephila inaurata madagascariensis]|uniref:Uncharacterized protein n=1 Tax=Trichonephila inaurata madagascariensis TaxID=2747483 RepID=A0A8X6XDF2_9ARAC|nr:uncharacterized protein TNIN_106471 [Trichonephila inaurata madagascariensis]